MADLILVVGTCASGKTTLATGLRQAGYNARAFALEHSHSPRVWRRRQPRWLVALCCTYDTLVARRGVLWPKARWLLQLEKIEDAWESADLRIVTDGLRPESLVHIAAEELERLVHSCQ